MNPRTTPTVVVRALRHQDYLPCLEQMRAFTANRSPDTDDEIWLVEHPPVFTQGLAGKPEHLLAPGDIPVVRTERGGQVTYHGPGQLLVYLLLDLHRRRLTVRDLVCRMEQAIIDCLRELGLATGRRTKAPGVYLEPAAQGAKIASLGLKVSRGCTFHGLALNINMDLAPFERINPCGYPGLRVTDLHGCAILQPMETVAGRLVQHLLGQLAEPPATKPAP